MAEIAIFGAGCFWGVEAAFAKTKGVINTEVGYAGGDTENPTYEEVCQKNTGHAEVVRVEFDSKKLTFDELLNVFWDCHDPTQLNRQGPDVGSQYRSVIFYTTPEQEQKAKSAKLNLQSSGRFRKPIATIIAPAPEFYRGEEYHQKYLEKRGAQSCGH